MGTTTTSSTTPDPYEPTNAAERVLSTLECEPRASIADTKALAFRLLAALLTFSAVPWRWFLTATTATRPAAFLRYLETLPEADAVDVLGALALVEGLDLAHGRVLAAEILLPRFGSGPLAPPVVVALETLRAPVQAVELRPGGFALAHEQHLEMGAELVDLHVVRVLGALRRELSTSPYGAA